MTGVQTCALPISFIKGDTQRKLPLRFLRIEPFVIPKRSLTGDSAERVDTRVLQIIFELDRPEVPLYVGQQVDVFVERTVAATPPSPAREGGAPPPAAP